MDHFTLVSQENKPEKGGIQERDAPDASAILGINSSCSPGTPELVFLLCILD